MKARRASTLDIISRTTSPAKLSLIAQTGDIVLCGVPRDTKGGWVQLIIAFGGSSTTQRRLPIVHVGVVIRNPPPEVRAAYSLPQDDDTQVYVLEATLRHGDGCRLMTMEAWVEDRVNGPVQYRNFYRTMSTRTEDRQMPQELWDWLLMAQKIPYFSFFSKDGSLVTYNACFSPGTYSSTLAAATELAMEMIKEKVVGKGPVGHIVAGIAGVLANICLTLVIAGLVYFTFFLSLPQLVLKKRIDRVHIGGDENIKGLHCSAAAAKTLMRAGLLHTTADAMWYQPRDFLPQGVGAHTNLLDDHLVPGVSYVPFLTEIIIPKSVTAPHPSSG